MSSPASRTPKGAATRADILRVAGDVFGSKGYALTRMDDVIVASGLTKGAIYFHFSSKADLARAVVQDHQQRWLDRVTEDVLSLSGPREQLLALVPVLTELVLQDHLAWSVGRLTRELELETGSGGLDPLREWVTLVADLLARGRDEGTLAFDDDPHDLAAVLVGTFDGVKSLTDAADGADPQAFRRRTRILQGLVEGLLA